MRIAVITGAAQGLGLETARQLSAEGIHVIITGRNEQALKEAMADIGNETEWHILDVSDDTSVDVFFNWLKNKHGRLDIFVNNAGRIYDGFEANIASTEATRVLDAVNNNSLSAYRMIRSAFPIMEKNNYGRIVNVSSGMGSLSDMGTGAVPYRVSKTALNAISVIAAQEAPSGILVNAVCPGWVRTEMGGPSATRSLDEGVYGIVWAATLPDDGPIGGFFRDGKTVEW